MKVFQQGQLTYSKIMTEVTHGVELSYIVELKFDHSGVNDATDIKHYEEAPKDVLVPYDGMGFRTD